MAEVRIEHLYKTYKGGVEAVKDLNLTIRDGEFLALLGPSGCGKTSTLRMIAGHETASAGDILLGNRNITDLPAVLRLVHELSPDEGGSGEAMIEPLRAALSLAALAGPEIVEGVKARARTWRGEAKYRRQSWEKVLDAELNELLGH